MRGDRWLHAPEVVVHKAKRLRGIHFLDEGCESAHVREVDGHHALHLIPLTHLGQLTPSEQREELEWNEAPTRFAETDDTFLIDVPLVRERQHQERGVHAEREM